MHNHWLIVNSSTTYTTNFLFFLGSIGAVTAACLRQIVWVQSFKSSPLSMATIILAKSLGSQWLQISYRSQDISTPTVWPPPIPGRLASACDGHSARGLAWCERPAGGGSLALAVRHTKLDAIWSHLKPSEASQDSQVWHLSIRCLATSSLP